MVFATRVAKSKQSQSSSSTAFENRTDFNTTATQLGLVSGRLTEKQYCLRSSLHARILETGKLLGEFTFLSLFLSARSIGQKRTLNGSTSQQPRGEGEEN